MLVQRRYNRAQISLFICCLGLCGFLWAYRYIPTREVYIALTSGLAAVGGVTLLLSKRRPAVALQTFWWSVLLVVVCMVAIDMRTFSTDGPPRIIAIPTVAVVILRLLADVWAARLYGVGVLALLLRVGAVYGGWEEVLLFIGVVVLAVIVSNRKRPSVKLRQVQRMLQADNERQENVIRRTAKRRG